MWLAVEVMDIFKILLVNEGSSEIHDQIGKLLGLLRDKICMSRNSITIDLDFFGEQMLKQQELGFGSLRKGWSQT